MVGSLLRLSHSTIDTHSTCSDHSNMAHEFAFYVQVPFALMTVCSDLAARPTICATKIHGQK